MGSTMRGKETEGPISADTLKAGPGMTESVGRLIQENSDTQLRC